MTVTPPPKLSWSAARLVAVATKRHQRKNTKLITVKSLQHPKRKAHVRGIAVTVLAECPAVVAAGKFPSTVRRAMIELKGHVRLAVAWAIIGRGVQQIVSQSHRCGATLEVGYWPEKNLFLV